MPVFVGLKPPSPGDTVQPKLECPAKRRQGAGTKTLQTIRQATFRRVALDLMAANLINHLRG